MICTHRGSPFRWTAPSVKPRSGASADVLVLSADGKGIVMRSDALRPATAKAAAAATNKLECRLSKGEKRNCKRLAEIGAVYDLTPVPGTPTDGLASKAGDAAAPAPKADAKCVTASVVQDAATVIAKVFDEAERRDPDHSRRWVALVDGTTIRSAGSKQQPTPRDVDVAIVVALIHVLEYLWGAVWYFFAEGDPAAQTWVHNRALAVLSGDARDFAAGIRRRASTARLNNQKRIKADACANFLTNKAAYLDYPTARASGSSGSTSSSVSTSTRRSRAPRSTRWPGPGEWIVAVLAETTRAIGPSMSHLARLVVTIDGTTHPAPPSRDGRLCTSRSVRRRTRQSKEIP